MAHRLIYVFYGHNIVFRSGFDPHFCLLKAICEAAQYDFGYRNGVIGDLIHVLFS